jgi:carbamoyl-phosphate synthase large subunit
MSSHFSECRLIGTDICENLYGLGEGLFERIYRVPFWKSNAYKAALRTVCEKETIDFAIVIPEPEVLLWSQSIDFVPAMVPPPRLCSIAICKRSLFDELADTGLVPAYRIYSRKDVLEGRTDGFGMSPYWLRDCTSGTTSGKGALMVTAPDEARAWALLQKQVSLFMASEFLPGRNFACCLLFQNDELLKFVSAERLQYFASHLVLSGITGNTCKGRLINDERVVSTAEKALRTLAERTGETLNGLFTVDLRENNRRVPLVTEINLRHVAFTSIFSDAGVNMAEAQLLATIGSQEKIDRREVAFDRENLFLRDIDGLPRWFDKWQAPHVDVDVWQRS